MEIREVKGNEYADAMEVAWHVFLKHNAPEYSLEGIQNFRKFLTDETLYKLFSMGEYRIFGFFDDTEKMEGMVSLRNKNHISLLFVDDSFRERGIGTKLLNYLCYYCWGYEGQNEVTVNSSPYAADFYRKYGFTDTGDIQQSDGITFIPMKYELNG